MFETHLLHFSVFFHYSTARLRADTTKATPQFVKSLLHIPFFAWLKMCTSSHKQLPNCLLLFLCQFGRERYMVGNNQITLDLLIAQFWHALSFDAMHLSRFSHLISLQYNLHHAMW
jgi:uncharacterized membrane protein (DUF106 family)